MALSSRKETIQVKDGAPVTLKLQRSPHGPIVNETLDNAPLTHPFTL